MDKLDGCPQICTEAGYGPVTSDAQSTRQKCVAYVTKGWFSRIPIECEYYPMASTADISSLIKLSEEQRPYINQPHTLRITFSDESQMELVIFPYIPEWC